MEEPYGGGMEGERLRASQRKGGENGRRKGRAGVSGDCHRSFACHTHRCSGRREGAGGEDREESKGAEKVKESASEEQTMERRKVSSTEKKIRRA